MALPDLRVRIGADTGQLDRAIGATQGKLKDFARNVAITVGGALTIGLVRDTLRATAQIDAYCERTFSATATATRYYDAVRDVSSDGILTPRGNRWFIGLIHYAEATK
jgi:hypothetical protein